MIKQYFILLFLIILATVEGLNTESRWSPLKVVGGDEVDRSTCPWIGSLREIRNGEAVHWAGLTLIDLNSQESIWMTAAHCCDWWLDSEVPQLQIYTTSKLSDIPQEGEIWKVTSMVKHPQYNANKLTFNGCCVTAVGGASVTSPTFQKISVCTKEKKVPGNMTWVYGWGSTTEDGDKSDSLNGVSVPIVEDKTCKDCYASIGEGFYPACEYCAGYLEGGKDSCYWDDGSGAIYYDLKGNPCLMGIVSFGNGCANPGFPGVYATASDLYPEYMEEI